MERGGGEMVPDRVKKRRESVRRRKRKQKGARARSPEGHRQIEREDIKIAIVRKDMKMEGQGESEMETGHVKKGTI